MIVADRGAGITTQKELYEYLLINLRIDPASLRGLVPSRLAEIARHYGSRRVKLLADLLKRKL